MSFNPGSLKTPKLRHAHEYWDSKRNGRKMPSRGDLDPGEMTEWLSDTLLADVTYDPLDFRFRLVGTNIAIHYGVDVTGRCLRELDLDQVAEQVFAEYALTVTTGEPTWFEDDFVSNSGKRMHYERLLMPLSDDGKTVNMLFGVRCRITGPSPIGNNPCKTRRV